MTMIDPADPMDAEGPRDEQPPPPEVVLLSDDEEAGPSRRAADDGAGPIRLEVTPEPTPVAFAGSSGVVSPSDVPADEPASQDVVELLDAEDDAPQVAEPPAQRETAEENATAPGEEADARGDAALTAEPIGPISHSRDLPDETQDAVAASVPPTAPNQDAKVDDAPRLEIGSDLNVADAEVRNGHDAAPESVDADVEPDDRADANAEANLDAMQTSERPETFSSDRDSAQARDAHPGKEGGEDLEDALGVDEEDGREKEEEEKGKEGKGDEDAPTGSLSSAKRKSAGVYREKGGKKWLYLNDVSEGAEEEGGQEEEDVDDSPPKPKSNFKGVTSVGKNKWMAQVYHKGVSLYLGRFDTQEDAARAWNRKAREVGRTDLNDVSDDDDVDEDDSTRNQTSSDHEAVTRSVGGNKQVAGSRLASELGRDDLNDVTDDEEDDAPHKTKSDYKGVSRAMGGKKWVARYYTGGRNEHLGTFAKERDAAKAWNERAMTFGREDLNVIEPERRLDPRDCVNRRIRKLFEPITGREVFKTPTYFEGTVTETLVENGLRLFRVSYDAWTDGETEKLTLEEVRTWTAEHHRFAIDEAVKRAAAAAAAGRTFADPSMSAAARALRNPVGGVVLGRSQPPPASDETAVLSHVFSPSMKARWRRANERWQRRNGLHAPGDVAFDDLSAAVVATVSGVRLAWCPEPRHPGIAKLDAAAALAELLLSTLTRVGDGSAAADLLDSAANLPAQIPYTDAVEPFEVPSGDPRLDLVGEIGVRAVRSIAAGTILGPVATYVCDDNEYNLRKFAAVEGAKRSLPPRLEHSRNMYTELDHDAFAADFQTVPAHEVGVVADAYGYGNLALAVNDPAVNPLSGENYEGDGGPIGEMTGKTNVHLVELEVHGFPFMFHVAVENIEPGEELLTDYGSGFWDTVREHKQRMRALFEANADAPAEAEPSPGTRVAASDGVDVDPSTPRLGKRKTKAGKPRRPPEQDDSMVCHLVQLGFDEASALDALQRKNGDLEAAAGYLFLKKASASMAAGAPAAAAVPPSDRREGNATATPAKQKKAFKGVRQKPGKSHWEARISHSGKTETLGYFATEKKAAKAWNRRARELGRDDLNDVSSDEEMPSAPPVGIVRKRKAVEEDPPAEGILRKRSTAPSSAANEGGNARANEPDGGFKIPKVAAATEKPKQREREPSPAGATDPRGSRRETRRAELRESPPKRRSPIRRREVENVDLRYEPYRGPGPTEPRGRLPPPRGRSPPPPRGRSPPRRGASPPRRRADSSSPPGAPRGLRWDVAPGASRDARRERCHLCGSRDHEPARCGICFFFRQGRCRYGDRCKKQHAVQQPRSGTESSTFCADCGARVFGPLDAHEASERHVKNRDRFKRLRPNDAKLRCDLCDVVVTSEKNWLPHVNGKMHRGNLAMRLNGTRTDRPNASDRGGSSPGDRPEPRRDRPEGDARRADRSPTRASDRDRDSIRSVYALGGPVDPRRAAPASHPPPRAAQGADPTGLEERVLIMAKKIGDLGWTREMITKNRDDLRHLASTGAPLSQEQQTLLAVLEAMTSAT